MRVFSSTVGAGRWGRQRQSRQQESTAARVTAARVTAARITAASDREERVESGWGWTNQRFLCKILLKSIDFESRGRRLGSVRDRKRIVFYLKSFSNVLILRAGACGSRRLGSVRDGKSNVFYVKCFSKVSILSAKN